jgi:hypothetical protein
MKIRMILFFSEILFLLLKRSVEESYRQQIAELQDQNERKDLRISLLEQKLQKLQVVLFP